MGRLKINIAIIEDDSIIREGLENFFNAQDEFNRVNAAESVEEFMALTIDTLDIVLTDIRLPGLSGIEGMRLLSAKYPQADIIMLTVFKDSDRIFKSLCAGATGYIVKGATLSVIKQSVITVIDGGSIMSPEIARKVMTYFSPNKKKESTHLTAREEQIIAGLVDGLSYKLIADRLTISIDTVRYHIKNIYVKLQVNSKSEVVSKLLRRNI